MSVINLFRNKMIQLIFMWIGVIFSLFFIIAALIYSQIPNWFSPPEEVFRLTSPNGKTDVIVATQDPAGAFGSSLAFLFIVEKGALLSEINVNGYNFKGDTIHTESIKWLSSTVVQFSRDYRENIHGFTPERFLGPEFNRQILIQLKSEDLNPQKNVKPST